MLITAAPPQIPEPGPADAHTAGSGRPLGPLTVSRSHQLVMLGSTSLPPWSSRLHTLVCPVSALLRAPLSISTAWLRSPHGVTTAVCMLKFPPLFPVGDSLQATEAWRPLPIWGFLAGGSQKSSCMPGLPSQPPPPQPHIQLSFPGAPPPAVVLDA